MSEVLGGVRKLSIGVVVMYLGRLVEMASCDSLFAAPVHPYTRALLAAVPQIPPVAASSPLIEGSLSLDSIDSGCAFRDRCPYALPLCASSDPPLAEIAGGRWVACHRSQETLNPLS